MEQFRCKNTKCRQPVLLEGDFVGEVRKICPKCKFMNVYKVFDINKLEKFCKAEKKL